MGQFDERRKTERTVLLERARADHAATMERLKGKSGREVEEEIVQSAHRLRLAHLKVARNV